MISRHVTQALERADYRVIDDGTFAATVRGLRGVVATGNTLEACRRELAEVGGARPRRNGAERHIPDVGVRENGCGLSER